jgi:hypothetical protein
MRTNNFKEKLIFDFIAAIAIYLSQYNNKVFQQ